MSATFLGEEPGPQNIPKKEEQSEEDRETVTNSEVDSDDIINISKRYIITISNRYIGGEVGYS